MEGFRMTKKILQEGDKYLVYTINICVETRYRHEDCLEGKEAFYNELQLLNELGEKTPGNLRQCSCCGKITGQ
jgi:hypothetical protein